MTFTLHTTNATAPQCRRVPTTASRMRPMMWSTRAFSKASTSDLRTCRPRNQGRHVAQWVFGPFPALSRRRRS